MRSIAKDERRYSRARKIHLVMDNLSTPSLTSVTATLGDKQAQRRWRRFEVHHTPNHASWLNVAEMEASLVSREYLRTTITPRSEHWGLTMNTE